MGMEIWMTFALAAAIVVVIPGPTVILVISQAIAHGRKAVLPLTAGVALGDFVAMTFSLAGLGAILAASAALFSVLKWIGAVYLVFIGVKYWRSQDQSDEFAAGIAAAGNLVLFRRAFVVTALNPKSIIFFIAFLPQFVRPAAPVMPQLLILGATFLFLATINAALYATFAGRLSDILQGARARRWLKRCGAAVLVGAGVFTAAMQRSA
jgi:threonine/homoserine/homoserine lactone efflux protein